MLAGICATTALAASSARCSKSSVVPLAASGARIPRFTSVVQKHCTVDTELISKINVMLTNTTHT